MIVRAHSVVLTEHLVSAGAVHDVTDEVEVMASYCVLYDSFAFAGRESCILNGDRIILSEESRVGINDLLFLVLITSLVEVEVNLLSKFLTSSQCDKTDRAYGCHRVVAVLVVAGISSFVRC